MARPPRRGGRHLRSDAMRRPKDRRSGRRGRGEEAGAVPKRPDGRTENGRSGRVDHISKNITNNDDNNQHSNTTHVHKHKLDINKHKHKYVHDDTTSITHQYWHDYHYRQQ